VSYLGGYNSD